MTPLTYGVCYTTVHLNQAGALVLVYEDGSVLLTHGGCEMGQGLHTKMIQVSKKFKKRISYIRITVVDHLKVMVFWLSILNRTKHQEISGRNLKYFGDHRCLSQSEESKCM